MSPDTRTLTSSRATARRRLPSRLLPFHLGLLCCVLTLLGCVSAVLAEESGARPITIGSKKFTESVILGETLRLLALDAGHPARHRAELGGTRILWGALLSGEIDVYPEYSGTLIREILATTRIESPADLEAALAAHGVRATDSLGFQNTYAIAVPAALAERLELRRISDLRAHPDLRLGFSSEFLDRADGWPGLRRSYGLPHTRVQGLDHDLVYRGIGAGHLDVTVVYTTDAEIAQYDLRMLEDDLGYFEDYQAMLLYREELDTLAPAVIAAFRGLEGTIDEATMARMNGAVKLAGASEQAVAATFLDDRLGVSVAISHSGFWHRLWQRTLEHLGMVSVSLIAAILVAVPLGVAAASHPKLGHLVLGITGMIQTIPSLALFVFLIPWLGIGWWPTVVALFLYSLLPIVRNTHAGLMDIPTPMRESADVLGLTRGARLRLVELPLAANTILAGIKTSAVLNVGTATVAALIGAGGYGQPILTGIRLDDTGLIMQGAIPAALLALGLQWFFELAERWVVPRGLRLRPRGGTEGT
ncbi:amino acid ABC transporter permease [Thiocapsa imhoffii]|uniref:Amino acid ABC transporter permease n=1 Tax=Thiocapsa imhoffii TaxID=382777 RepID=A0A9X0WHF0_9GAMM|nr:glycine betaine ABC transporter substrate-binding protein [Thiocapsa imhoffii]MBK1644776.1 amino acid ABC transporter permease [Thiocapsa imhoffii]